MDGRKDCTRSGQLVTLPTKRRQPVPLENGTNKVNKKSLQMCTFYGWQKVMTPRGLHIYQGRMKCGRLTNQCTCTASAGQTSGTKSPVANHRAAGPNSAGRSTAEHSTLQTDAVPQGDVITSPPAEVQLARQNKTLERHSKIRWPRSKDQEE